MSANCYAFQPCDFTLNSGHLTYMVICVHCYIYVGVSHNILKNFYVYSLFCHSGTSRMSHNVWACPFIPVINWFLQRRKKSLNQTIVKIIEQKIDLYSSKTKLLESFFPPTTFFIFKPLKHNTVQSTSSNYYIYSFHTPFGKFHFPSVHRTSYHNQMPKQHHSHGFPLLSDLCSLSV